MYLYHFRFLFNRSTFAELIQVRPSRLPKKTSWNCFSRCFTGQMPFLSPNQQRQSTERWQYQQIFHTILVGVFATKQQRCMINKILHQVLNCTVYITQKQFNMPSQQRTIYAYFAPEYVSSYRTTSCDLVYSRQTDVRVHFYSWQ